MMRVLYVGVKDNRVALISYNGVETKKCKSKPNYHIVSRTGFHLSKGYVNNDYVEIDTLVLKSYELDFSKLMSDILSLLEEDTIIISTTNNVVPILNYIRFGNTENGIFTKDFKDGGDIALLTKNKAQELKTKFLSFRNINDEHIMSIFGKLLHNIDIDIEVEGKEFFNPKRYTHPFIDGKYIVVDKDTFKSDSGYNITTVNYPTSQELGRPLPGISVNIAKINDIPGFWVDTVEKMFKILGTDKRLFVLPLDNMTDKIVIQVMRYTNNALIVKEKEHQCVLLNKAEQTVAYTPYPPALIRVIKDNVKFNVGCHFNEMDITRYIYKDGKIKPEIPMGGYSFKVMTHLNMSVTLFLGVTMLKRNILKKIEKKVVSIKLRYILVDKVLRYNTEVLLNTGERVITYSPQNGFMV